VQLDRLLRSETRKILLKRRRFGTTVERLEISARSPAQPHHQVIERIGEKTCFAFTYRHEKIRIISVRGTRADDEARYLAQTQALSAARLEEMHDAGENLSAHLEFAKATPHQ
jgi:uncharacterized DUF497 family protein